MAGTNMTFSLRLDKSINGYKALNNSLKGVFKWLTVVHVPRVAHMGEISTRYSLEVKTT